MSDARDRRADKRDQRADERDDAADERDDAATDRDVAFDVRDRIPPTGSVRSLGASSDRRGARGDRRHAAGDRQQASRDRIEATAEMAEASLDELTGAHRRGAGFVELEREMSRARRLLGTLVLAFVDVDGLKAVNDSQGHTAGDAVLRSVADTLHRTLRPYDLVIRFGGDEFLCVIPDITMAEAAERLGGVAGVTVGLADMADDDTMPTLIQRADAALYRQRDTVIDVRTQAADAQN